MSRTRLLVVDDHELNRDMLSRWMRQEGFDVTVAADGRSALAAIEQAPFDLMLVDIEMPMMSGLEVLRRVRERYSPSDLAVVMVSGRQDSESIVSALELGANDYLTKPIDFAVALARVNSQLGRLRLEAARRSIDPLTGLANRAALIAWSNEQPSRGRPAAAMAVNLDRFRTINSGLGRAYGDRLLIETARRLQALLPASALAARAHGDDFVCLLHDVDARQAGEYAARMVEAVREPVDLAGQRISVTASIGLASSASATAPEALLDQADAALYRAKTMSGDRWERFAPAMQSRASARLQLEVELHEAIARREFELRYEAIVDIASGAVVGVEALVRWRHPSRGEVAPAEFIPIAEETRLILPIGGLVFGMACAQLRDWQSRGAVGREFRMSINISARQIEDAAFIDDLRRTIQETRVDPRNLVLEITERVLLEQSDRIRVVFDRARALGMQIALDDFGTGYSSLGYLQNFAVDTIKIDRSFVQGLDRPEGAEIVRTLVRLAGTLRMEAIAEGVDAGWQLAALRQAGCTKAQGYFFSRPMRPADVLAAARAGFAVSQ